MNVIEAARLGKRYWTTWALRDCTLAVPAGRVAALAGPNGAGKTTLMHLAVGLTAPTEGTVTVLGGQPAGSPEALSRVAAGGTALDPEVVTQLFGASRRTDTLDRLSPREREVLGLMAEGRSNTDIAGALVISDRAVEKHVANIFTKLDLPVSDTDHRRVLAVLRYMRGQG